MLPSVVFLFSVLLVLLVMMMVVMMLMPILVPSKTVLMVPMLLVLSAVSAGAFVPSVDAAGVASSGAAAQGGRVHPTAP